LSVTLPLFVVIIAVAIFGVIAGGVATWLGQRRWRKAARLHEAEARHARAQLADFRAQAQGTGDRQVPPALGYRPQYGAIGRDKHGVTL
jgi:type II secretory pathway pseudopilin PulG